MKKDLILGAADNYGWPHVRPWAKSIKESGFNGDVVLIVYRVTPELIRECGALGIHIVQANHNEMAQPIDHTKLGMQTQSHQLRSFHMWQFLQDSEEKYRFVICTDTRDIYFQTNPSEWLTRTISHSDTTWHQDQKKLFLPSEAILFEKEDWNGKMLREGFGPFIWEYLMKNKPACNSGSFFGEMEIMKQMFLTMFLVCKSIGKSGIDQATMNVLGATAFQQYTQILPMDSGWGCQCGTVLDPTKSYLWERLHEPIPKILDSGIVVNSKDEPFVLVHQYDRVPTLTAIITERYA